MESISREYAITIAYTLSYFIVGLGDNMRHYLAFNWYVWFFIGIMLTSVTQGEKAK